MFKKKKPTDIQLVYKASSWLGISEFQIFFDAWQEWYYEEPSEKKIESHFINFLEHDAVPFWVRNYVRSSILNRKDLLEKEKKRLFIGTITYYIPLLVFLMVIMWAFYK